MALRGTQLSTDWARHTSTSLASAFTPIGQRELHRNHINLKQSGYSDLAAKSISLGAGLGRYTGVESLENAREGRWEDGAALTSYQRAGQFALGTFGVVTTATGAAKGITGAVSNAGAQGLSRQAVQRFTPYFDNSAASPAGAANPAPVGGVVEVAAEGLLELPVLNPHFTPNGTSVLQNLTKQVNQGFASDLSLATTVLSRAELDAAAASRGIARMQYGNAVERLVAQRIKSDSTFKSLYEHVGGPNNPDFIGKGLFQGMNFDITTPGQVGVHLARPGYGQGLNVITYERPAGFP